MSQLFGRISKLSSPLNRSLCFRRSGYSTATSPPYLLLGSDRVGKSPCGGEVVNLNLYDPRKEEQVKMEHQILWKNLRGSSKIGSSRGWVATMKKRDSTVSLTNILESPSKTISLPPLVKDETERLLNVSVSSEEDFVVAARFYGSRLSLCRPGDSEWTRIDVPCPAFRLSPVMYSDSDRKFYLNSCGSDYTGPTDFTSKSGLVSPVSGYVRLPLSNYPNLDNHLRLQRVNVHQLLVQSPSGESFIVLWAVDSFTDKGEAVEWKAEMHNQDDIHIKTHKIKVFRQDTEKGIGAYTDDIGDLCIFVGENEPFCLSASILVSNLTLSTLLVIAPVTAFATIHYQTHLPRHRLFWIPPTTPH